MENILNKFTMRSLKLNIKRTVATCIGIILSTALICAVAGVFSSFQQTLIEHTKTSDGDYHTMFYEIPKDEQKYILENRNVASSFITQGVGYSKLDGSKNDYKPYLYLMEFDENALNSLGLKLIEGRMPENSNELVIPQHIEDNGGVEYKVGDKVTLDVGKRVAEGEELNQHNPYNNPKDSDESGYIEEHLESTGEKREFTIVGIIKRPNMEIEDYSAPGYTVITKLDYIRDNANIAVKFKNIKDTYKITREIAEDETQKSSDPDHWIAKYDYNTNSELLRWSGVTRSDDTMTMFYSLAGIVIGIIVVSSVFVIRNSFAISITEKMKQYGMLASIGATKKQIKKNVLFEGMILGLISIPIGILCGVLATFILIQITTALVGNIAFSEEIKFVFNIPLLAVGISVLLGFVTIYLSCIFSARKASKVSPIDAIRSNEDIKIKSKKIKSPKIIKKIFGVGGEIAYKNLKRNKKKYRTTVISLVVSITVFISLTTFMNYTFDMSGLYYQEMDYNVSLSSYYGEERREEDQNKVYQYYQELAKKYNLEEYRINRTANISADMSDKLTDEYKNMHSKSEEFDYKSFYIYVESIGEKAYREYVKELGGKYEDYKDGIIYYDNSLFDDNGNKIDVTNIKKNDEINGKIQGTEETINLKILKVADKPPMASNSSSPYGMFIVSDEMMDSIGKFYCNSMRINAKDPDKLCKDIKEENDSLPAEERFTLYVTNYKEEADEQNRMVLLISIFLYGFIVVISLIGVTNIFNTITTNMNLRSKEFAMLKSIGMTKKEFNKMINLESIFYGVKSLIIGITLGMGISYWIYKVVIGADATSDLEFLWPTKAIIISIVFIAVIVGIIMKYSLNKINKQNIIETIRNENI